MEERITDGYMYMDSSDLELVYDPGVTKANQSVGMRFNGVSIPRGATITQAYVEFQVDETSSEATSLVLHGEAADNAAAFSTSARNVTSRVRTSASTAWNNIPAWTAVGAKVQSPDLSGVVQEIVNRTGWSAGNSLVILVDGSGRRVASAYESGAATAAILHVAYLPAGASASPTPPPAPTQTPTTPPQPTATSLPPTPTRTPTATSLPPTPTPGSIQPVGQTGTWKLIFSDEFNSTTLDTSKWTPNWFGTGITGPVNSAETACYDSSQVSVPGDGSLHLPLISKSQTCGGAVRPYTGALVSSNGKFQYTYGYFEVRAYLPASSTGVIANWPAVWSDGQSWPTDGENDTMEGLGGLACYHFHSPLGGPGACASGNYTGWHIFASDWEPGSVTYYYDGVKVGQITTGITTSPQYLILNNTQGSYGGPTLVPVVMLVDYVRVWQK